MIIFRETAMDMLRFVKVTEAAALASAQWIGKMDKHAADGAAVDAMRSEFELLDIRGTVVIGEGELDEAPMLYIGENLGTGRGDKCDIAVDPLEGTEFVAKGQPGAISVLAVADWGCLMRAPDCYMQKLVVGPKARHASINLDWSTKQNLTNVADQLGKSVRELKVCILDRPRHHTLIQEVLELGAAVSLISNGDVLAAVGVCMNQYDVLMGVGGAPEGVISAAAVGNLGGAMLGRLVLDTPELQVRAAQMHKDAHTQYTQVDMAYGQGLTFIATGITSSFLLNGISNNTTHSVILTSNQTTFITTTHR